MLSFLPRLPGRRTDGRTAAAPPAAGDRRPARAALRLMAVEPRMLFDGAVLATADAAIAVEKTLPPVLANRPPVAAADCRAVDEGKILGDGQAVRGNPQGDTADCDPDGDPLTVVGVAAGNVGKPVSGQVGAAIVGAYGTLELQSSGAYRYTATADLKAGQAAQDVFTYTISDGRGGLDTTTITIVVCGVGSPPTPQADCRDVAACSVISDGQAVAGNTLGDAADTDPDGEVLQVTGVAFGQTGGTPTGCVGVPVDGCFGTLTLQADGAYTYVPFKGLSVPAGGALVDVFTYTVTDPTGLSAATTLTVAVRPCCDPAVDRPPVAVDDARTITEDQRIDDGQAIAGNALGDRADRDPEGGRLVATGVAAGNALGPLSTGIGAPIAGVWGTLTLRDDGRYVYVPGPSAQSLRDGQTVTDVFTYSIADPCGATASATLTITLVGVNDAPCALDDIRCIDARGSVTDGEAVRGNALGDVADLDVDAGDTLTVVGARAGAAGGPVSGGVSTALAGAWGTLTLGADGRYTYAPAPRAATLAAGQRASDVFTYTIRDTAGALSSATITICIDGVGTGGSLVANPDARTTDERTAIAGNVVTGGQPGEQPDLDSDGRPIVVQGVTAGATGVAQTGRVGQAVAGTWGTLTVQADGSYTYVPGSVARSLGQGDAVDDVFTYTVRDDAGRVATTTLTIRVLGLNDPPVARADQRTLDERTTVTDGEAVRGNARGDVADTDPDAGDTLTVVGAAAGTAGGPVAGGVGTPIAGVHGTLTIDAQGRYAYVPGPGVLDLRAGQQVVDTFTYTIRDGAGATSTSTITIRIDGLDPLLQARPDQRVTDERTPVSGNAVTGGLPGEQSDVDSEGRPIVVQGVAAGVSGTSLDRGVGTPIAGTWGTLVLGTDGRYTWTPNAAARGLPQGQQVVDVFSYTVNDGAGAVSTTTITIRIDGLNDPPVANPDERTVTVGERIGDGQAVAGSPGGDRRDTDPDAGDTLRVVGATAGAVSGSVAGGVGVPITGAYGTLTLRPDGSYVYAPDRPAALSLLPGQTVRDTFTYTIDDGHGGRSSTTLTVTVLAANHPPTANPDGKVVTVGTTDPVTGNTVAHGTPGDQADTDPDAGDTLTVTAVQAAGAAAPARPGDPVKGAYGTLVLDPDGSYRYWLDNTHPAVAALPVGGRLVDTFTYTVRDGGGATASTTVTIEIVRPDAGSGTPVTPLPAQPTTGGGSTTGGTSGLSPTYSDIVVRPAPDAPPPVVLDPFNPFGVERVKGTVEERDASSTTEEAPDPASLRAPVRPTDDCIPEEAFKAQRKPVAVKDAPKPKARPSVFAKEAVVPPKRFSEQVTAAKKRFKPPVKVAPPAPAQRIC